MNKFSTIKGNKFGQVNRSCPVHKANEMIRMQCKKYGGHDHTYCCNKYNPFHRDPVPCIYVDEPCDEPVIEPVICHKEYHEEPLIEEQPVVEHYEKPVVELDDCTYEDIYAVPEESFVIEKKDIVVTKPGMATLDYKQLVKKQIYTW